MYLPLSQVPLNDVKYTEGIQGRCSTLFGSSSCIYLEKLVSTYLYNSKLITTHELPILSSDLITFTFVELISQFFCPYLVRLTKDLNHFNDFDDYEYNLQKIFQGCEVIPPPWIPRNFRQYSPFEIWSLASSSSTKYLSLVVEMSEMRRSIPRIMSFLHRRAVHDYERQCKTSLVKILEFHL